MSTVYHDQKNPAIYKVTHFTPAARKCWRWLVFIPAITASGPQQTITGETVDIGSGTTLWTGLPGAPTFENREDAMRWTDLMQLPNVIAEL